MTDEEIRQRFVGAAVAVEGLSAAPETRDAYLDVVAPCRTDRASPRICDELCMMSSCALTVRGLWFLGGVRHRILTSPYRNGRAVSDVIEIARDARALRSATRKPQLGDVVVVEQPEHVLTVVGWRDDVALCSVDGGQRDAKGFELIAHRERPYDATRMRIGGRPILYVIDCIALATLIAAEAA